MKKFSSFAFVVSAVVLAPLSSFAQAFTHATCEQEYGYEGGYELDIQSLNAGATQLSVKISRHKGPDGDGEYQAEHLESASLTGSSAANSYTYKLDSGTLQLDVQASTGTLVTSRSRYPAVMTCKFDHSRVGTATDVTTRNCSNELAMTEKVQVRDNQGVDYRGFGSSVYTEERPNSASIVLETKTTVYYVSGTSDISASLYACDKATTSVKELFQSHSISCSDLPAVDASTVLYSDCK